jgi:hypothetical protein
VNRNLVQRLDRVWGEAAGEIHDLGQLLGLAAGITGDPLLELPRVIRSEGYARVPR